MLKILEMVEYREKKKKTNELEYKECLTVSYMVNKRNSCLLCIVCDKPIHINATESMLILVINCMARI